VLRATWRFLQATTTVQLHVEAVGEIAEEIANFNLILSVPVALEICKTQRRDVIVCLEHICHFQYFGGGQITPALPQSISGW
jgi:hypothetical protein